jgi:hypothetical protein
MAIKNIRRNRKNLQIGGGGKIKSGLKSGLKSLSNLATSGKVLSTTRKTAAKLVGKTAGATVGAVTSVLINTPLSIARGLGLKKTTGQSDIANPNVKESYATKVPRGTSECLGRKLAGPGISSNATKLLVPFTQLELKYV